MEDYLELMATYGYLTLFAASLPLAPALAFLTIVIEGKVDAYKYTRLVKRPFPERAANIGLWEQILQFMMIAAVVTNLGIIILTDNKFEMADHEQWVTFILIEHTFLLLVWILQAVIPDED